MAARTPPRLAGLGLPPALCLLATLCGAPPVTAAAAPVQQTPPSTTSHQPVGGPAPSEPTKEGRSAGARPGGAAEAAAGAPPIVLNTKLRLLLRPVVLGLVAPTDPRGYGECLLRLTSVTAGELGVQYEIKERLPLSQPSPPHQLAGVTDTQIRRGRLRLRRAEGSPAGLLPPGEWPQGVAELPGGLLWLSQAQFSALKESGRLKWGLAGQAGAGELVLSEGPARYPCIVNGRELLLPALRAQDGQADYWILDQADNPLVLKCCGRSADPGGAGRPGAGGGAAGQAESTDERADAYDAPMLEPGDEALALVNPGSRARRLREAAPVAEARGGPAAGAAEAQGIGTGFAVVEINF